MPKGEGILEESRVGSSKAPSNRRYSLHLNFFKHCVYFFVFLLSESIASQQIRYALHPAIVCYENYSESESDLSVAGIAPY